MEESRETVLFVICGHQAFLGIEIYIFATHYTHSIRLLDELDFRETVL